MLGVNPSDCRLWHYDTGLKLEFLEPQLSRNVQHLFTYKHVLVLEEKNEVGKYSSDLTERAKVRVSRVILSSDPFLPQEGAFNMECSICLENQKTIACLPCGHLCLCYACSTDVPETCPICRQKLTDKVKIFY